MSRWLWVNIIWKTWLYKRVQRIQQRLLHIYQEARKPIHVTPQYSPMRFTTGLSPVTLHFKGWGLCVYGTKIRQFNDSILRITVPINEEATLLLVGWGKGICRIFQSTSPPLFNTLKTSLSLRIRLQPKHPCQVSRSLPLHIPLLYPKSASVYRSPHQLKSSGRTDDSPRVSGGVVNLPPSLRQSPSGLLERIALGSVQEVTFGSWKTLPYRIASNIRDLAGALSQVLASQC